MAAQAPALPPHPTRKLFYRWIALGSLYSVIAVASLAFAPAMSGFFGVAAVFALFLGIRGVRAGGAIQLVNSAAARVAERKFVEAEAILDGLDKVKSPVVRRVSDLHRGIIALRRGDAHKAIAYFDRVISLRKELVGRANAEVKIALAHGLRAFARASVNEEKGARDDISAVEQNPGAGIEAHGYAEVARAVLIERSGDREALRAQLEKNGGLLFDGTSIRERAIVRGFQRLLRVRTTSVYRNAPALPVDEPEEPELAAWVARIAPSAAPFVRVATPDAGDKAMALPAPTEEAMRRIATVHKPRSSARASARVIALIVLFGVLFFALWQLFTPGNTSIEPPVGAIGEVMTSFAAVLVTTLIASVAYTLYAARRETHQLAEATVLRARGDRARSDAITAKLKKSRRKMIAASARLFEAQGLERSGRFEEALARCDEAIALLSTPAFRAASSDLLYPEIVSERALVLAALDRADEAAAEIATLKPPFPFIARSRTRVALMIAVRRGELERGAGLVAAAAETTLPRRDELLGDLLRATHGSRSVGAVETDRLKEELRTYDEGRRWVLAVAPSVLDAFNRASPADDDEAGEPKATDEEAALVAEAEREVEAALEAEDAPARPRLRST